MSSFLTSALKNKIFWYMASRYGTFAIQFLSSIWLAVKLGPYYFGLWSFILLLVNIGSQCNWGIANAVNILLVQHKEDNPQCAAYEYNALLMTAVICTIPFLIALYDTFFPIALFAKYHLGHLSYAVAFIVSCFYLNSLFINIFRVKNRILEIAINQSLFPVLTFLVIFFTTDYTLLKLLVIMYVLAMVVSIGLFLRPRLITTRGTLSMPIMRTIFTKGFYLFLYNACFYLIMLSTKMLISAYYPVETFGYFAFAFNVANATMLFIDSLMFLLFPKMIDLLKGQDKEVIRERLSIARICYITTMFILFSVAFVAFGILIKCMPRYESSYTIFFGIVFSLFVYTLCFGYNIYMLAQNQERRLALYSMSALFCNISCVWILASILQVHVVMCLVGTAVSYLIYVVFVNSYARKRLEVISYKPKLSSFCAAADVVRKVFRGARVVDL